ncbi:MAG: GNAT family N-acetyltransferase [Deltaproteobacteria bacterium]|nr:MAG: GNAT family N-acetyltransferase [Deltaproteobacteria bacterium]
MEGEIRIRRMNVNDVESVLAIDEKITGRPHEAQWESKILEHLSSNPLGCLVAEVDGRVVGFVIGTIRGWEFGIPKCGWIEIVGVDPDYRRKGVARALIDALEPFFRMNSVPSVKTMIDWNDGGLVSFFSSLGFKRSEYIILEKPLEEEEKPG